MYGQGAEHEPGKLNGIRFSLHGHAGLQQSFRDESVAIEAQGQRRDRIEHPSKNVVFLEEAPVLFKKLALKRAQ